MEAYAHLANAPVELNVSMLCTEAEAIRTALGEKSQYENRHHFDGSTDTARFLQRVYHALNEALT